MVADLHDTAAARLRNVGQRYTPNRRVIVELLSDAASPRTIPELLADGRNAVPQSSAYRNLAVLEQAGVVRRLFTSGEFASFELAEDLTAHHHHLVCSACGRVEDFTAPSALERSLGRVASEVNGTTGFVADHHRLDLVGTCASCA